MQWHTPIGYKVINGRIEICEEHRKLVEQIFRDYDSGISAWRIARNLKEMEVKNAHDRVGWSHASIGRILENHNYLGTEYYPRIIEQDLFDRVQQRREQTRIEGSRGKHRPNRRERLIFSGMLICAECGGIYTHVQPHNKKRQNEVAKWKCKNYIYHNKVSCNGGFISDRQLEAVCIRAINMLLENRSLVENYKEKPQQISTKYRILEQRIEKAEALGADEMMGLLFERAAERYKTLEVRDEGIKSEEMKNTLAGRAEIMEFDEELYRKLIRQILVYKNGTVRVIFHNSNSVKIEYQQV